MERDKLNKLLDVYWYFEDETTEAEEAFEFLNKYHINWIDKTAIIGAADIIKYKSSTGLYVISSFSLGLATSLFKHDGICWKDFKRSYLDEPVRLMEYLTV